MKTEQLSDRVSALQGDLEDEKNRSLANLINSKIDEKRMNKITEAIVNLTKSVDVGDGLNTDIQNMVKETEMIHKIDFEKEISTLNILILLSWNFTVY